MGDTTDESGSENENEARVSAMKISIGWRGGGSPIAFSLRQPPKIAHNRERVVITLDLFLFFCL